MYHVITFLHKIVCNQHDFCKYLIWTLQNSLLNLWSLSISLQLMHICFIYKYLLPWGIKVYPVVLLEGKMCLFSTAVLILMTGESLHDCACAVYMGLRHSIYGSPVCMLISLPSFSIFSSFFSIWGKIKSPKLTPLSTSYIHIFCLFSQVQHSAITDRV